MAIVKVGPWGSKDGVTSWTFKPDDFLRFVKICIATGDCVNSITFTAEDIYHATHISKHGGDGGTNHTINFTEDEEITRISGTFGEHDKHTVITSLSIDTNKDNYGPFGQNLGTSFSLPVAKGKFVGFYGTHGDYVESLGAFLTSVSYY